LFLHRALLRRMVLEDYSPKYQDVSRIIEGKAREFRVQTNELLAEEQVLTNLFTEVFDNDLIAPTQRIEIENRLNGVFEETEKKPKFRDFAYDTEVSNSKEERIKNITFLMALIASLMGATSTVLLKFIGSNSIKLNAEWFLSGVGVLITSLIAVAGIALIKKAKEFPEQPSKKAQQQVSSSFELDIAKILDSLGAKYQVEPDYGERFSPDFHVVIGDLKIAIETKAWKAMPPVTVLKRTVMMLKYYVDRGEADKAILVTKDNLPISKEALSEDNIEIFTSSEFAKYIKNKLKSV
jgi:hypothetical protein